MHNSIIREFEDHPGVVTRIFNEGGQHNETLDWTLTFWDNYFPRGSILFDESGSIGDIYEQPQTGLPFGRGFIIDQEGRIDTPYFGHKPAEAIARIHELAGTTSTSAPAPDVLSISAFPNPFNPRTRIQFTSSGGEVRLAIFGIDGRCLRLLREGRLPAGKHQVDWDGRDDGGRRLPSGVYLIRLDSEAGHAAARAVLLK